MLLREIGWKRERRNGMPFGFLLVSVQMTDPATFRCRVFEIERLNVLVDFDHVVLVAGPRTHYVT
jgi:hypothetical protein